ncbi:hypothetical protein DFR70_103339 [Nocardia tenerifensis]|uniref:Uncharacterized protein n=1 Tax=Nocardia tenerifensis TaxID=228006 RepID=A0A318K574_9NOCA|nr:hypothetical protein [Nocardia tenerifensis]PXX66590.1 hypothetical protein DFR70_103339 [Nocardia tenerifensis]
MLLDYPTEDELWQSFATALAAVRSGGGVSSDNGLDLRTVDALWEIADAYPNIPEELIAAAHVAFAGQLDGSNAAAREAAINRAFEQE